MRGLQAAHVAQLLLSRFVQRQPSRDVGLVPAKRVPLGVQALERGGQRVQIRARLARELAVLRVDAVGQRTPVLVVGGDARFQLAHLIFGKAGETVIRFVRKFVFGKRTGEHLLKPRALRSQPGMRLCGALPPGLALRERTARALQRASRVELRAGDSAGLVRCLPDARFQRAARVVFLNAARGKLFFLNLHGGAHAGKRRVNRLNRGGRGALRLFGAFQRFAGNGRVGGLRRGGMLRGAAHGARLALAQTGGQQAALAEVVRVLYAGIGLVRAAARVQRLHELGLELGFLRGAGLQLGKKRQAFPKLRGQPVLLFRLRQRALCVRVGGLQRGQRFANHRALLFGLGQRPFGGDQPICVLAAQRLGGREPQGAAGAGKASRVVVDGALGFDQLVQRRAAAVEQREVVVDILRVGQRGGGVGQPMVGGFQPGRGACPLFILKREQTVHRREQPVGVFRLGQVQRERLPARVVLIHVHARCGDLQPLLQRVARLLCGGVFLLETQLQLRVLERAEQPLKQVAPLGRFGVENLQKIALRDHHGLRELVAGQPDQLLHALSDFIQSRPAFAGVGLKLRRVLAHNCAVAALAGARVFGIAAQTVVVPPVAERQLHPRILRLGGVV